MMNEKHVQKKPGVDHSIASVVDLGTYEVAHENFFHKNNHVAILNKKLGNDSRICSQNPLGPWFLWIDSICVLQFLIRSWHRIMPITIDNRNPPTIERSIRWERRWEIWPSARPHLEMTTAPTASCLYRLKADTAITSPHPCLATLYLTHWVHPTLLMMRGRSTNPVLPQTSAHPINVGTITLPSSYGANTDVTVVPAARAWPLTNHVCTCSHCGALLCSV